VALKLPSKSIFLEKHSKNLSLLKSTIIMPTSKLLPMVKEWIMDASSNVLQMHLTASIAGKIGNAGQNVQVPKLFPASWVVSNYQ